MVYLSIEVMNADIFCGVGVAVGALMGLETPTVIVAAVEVPTGLKGPRHHLKALVFTRQ